MDQWDLDIPAAKQPGGSPGGADATKDHSEAPRSDHADGAQASVSSGPAVGVHPPADGPKRRRWSRLTGWIVAALVLVLIGALAGFFIARSQWASDSVELAEARDELAAVKSALAHAEERNWTYYRKTQALAAQLEGKSAEAPGSGSTIVTSPAPVGTYGDGVYLVGEDISPGTYNGSVTGEAGYWARLKGTDGLVSSIIANALVRGPFVLTVVESDRAVELRGVVITAR